MSPIKLIRSALAAVRDPERDLTERVFLILTFISEVTVGIAFIGDLITGESLPELIVLAAVLILVPMLTLICLHLNRLEVAIRIITLCLVILIIPLLFFFGGGLKGGGFLWIIFAFIYAGLVLKGKWRIVIFILIPFQTLLCFVIAYHHPEFVYTHSRQMYYVDIFLSLIMVGMLCYIMAWSQGKLFAEENKRARNEAKRAEDLTRSQNRFFSNMSHEIRTPINSILGLNELILRDQEATEEIIRDASGIQGSGKMLLSLINDILDFSKIEAGSMDIVPVDYRIGDMLSEIVNMMWLRARDKGLDFEVSIDPEVPAVLYGDEVRIKQVIINLLNNAVKYTKEGRVELRLDSSSVDDDTVELVISVSDTGMGIKKEDMPYLFDAFKRVDEGKNRHIEGTGLGLSIVSQLIELMDGNIRVNSVYGEGSTFTCTIRQKVTDRTQVGELNIHNQQNGRRSNYESSFLAPEVRILIVDDNEMNLEVERRLLTDTDMGIDTAKNGKEALDKCLKVHYDTIFMDHLMPEMDGIECLEQLREQEGGLNRTTPVIILTANAGSENRELYNRAGFDGYLVKPVSGQAMEEMLIRHIPGDKLILRSVLKGDDEEIHTADRYAEKVPVIITSSSMCDLPDSVIRKLHIPIIPFVITTEQGVFKDGVHIDAYEMIRHLSSGKSAVSSPPDEAQYTEFFADVLKRTHHVIHISITTSMSEEFHVAGEAAKSFDNVTVINSECISSATGILVLIAYKLVQQGIPAQEIVQELESVKKRLKCSFVIDTTDYLAKKSLIGKNLHRIAQTLNLHPALTIREDRTGIGGVWSGRTRRAYRKYISRALPPDTIPDADVVFITYVDLTAETLMWIEEEIRKTAYFEHVVFQQASAAISSNCGPGTFGILYFLKSNKSYNIASFLDYRSGKGESADSGDQDVYGEAMPGAEDEMQDEDTYDEDFDPDDEEYTETSSDDGDDVSAKAWYDGIAGLDVKTAIANSGSESAFGAVLKIFYESIPDKHAELERNYSSEDWGSYTIKIHALKSSARLVGAMELGAAAESLEMAGKEGDIAYIRDHHAAVMGDYLKYHEILAPVFAGEGGAEQEEDTRPEADDFLMESIYEELADAAENMDCDRVEAIMKEIGEYRIPDTEKERFEKVRGKAGIFDYEGILSAIGP
ncbi:MAG: DegV family EDD domain-containing protein [Lachnospiraceae bacterium]|nr:DegV family EDD domain-containing protein [Lachnospiraceae bacterium]